MVQLKTIQLMWRIKNILNTKRIGLSGINHKNLSKILKQYGISLKLNSLKDWKNFKKTNKYNKLLKDIDELYILGYGNKFISLCLSIKYQIFISHQIIHKKIKKDNKNRLSYSIDERKFPTSDIIIKGRMIYNKSANSYYLTFKCVNLRDIAIPNRIGILVFYSKNSKKVFLKRDDRAAKKIIVSSNDLFVSLYPITKELKEYLVDTKKTYKSFSVEVHFNSNNFGFQREELIDDLYAKNLYPKLKKFGFELIKERTTSMSRSKGDLILKKDYKKIVIEITDLGKKEPIKNKYVRAHMHRDSLIGKIMRILTLNKNFFVIFVFNNQIKKNVINDDFRKIIEKYKINIIFTDFKKDWPNEVSKEIYKLLKSK